MFDIINVLFNLCLFKKRPQDLPYSLFFLQLLMAMNLVVSFLIINIRDYWLSALLQSIVGVVLVGVFSWLSLWIGSKTSRFYQTTAALLGADTLIGFFALPATATMILGQGSWLAFLVMIALIIWHWTIIGHIMRHALEQSLSVSLGLALLYLVASYRIMALLFTEINN